MGVPARSWSGVLLADGTVPVDGPGLEGYLDELADILDPVVTGITNSNVATGADIDAAKLADGTILTAKIGGSQITAALMAALAVEDTSVLWNSTSGVKAMRSPSTQRKILYGEFWITAAGAGTFTGVSGNEDRWNGGAAGATSTHTVIFATHCPDWVTDFTAGPAGSPFICIGVENTNLAEKLTHSLRSVTTAQFGLELMETTGAAGYAPGGTIKVNFVAIGGSAQGTP